MKMRLMRITPNMIAFVRKRISTMKTTQTKKTKSDRKPQASAGLNKSDDALAVIRDVSSGKEYFLSIIDSFSLSGRDYAVMYNYEPDDGNHADPELSLIHISEPTRRTPIS